MKNLHGVCLRTVAWLLVGGADFGLPALPGFSADRGAGTLGSAEHDGRRRGRSLDREQRGGGP